MFLLSVIYLRIFLKGGKFVWKWVYICSDVFMDTKFKVVDRTLDFRDV